MRAMRLMLCLSLLLCAALVRAEAPLTEDEFRGTLGMPPGAQLAYRDLQCKSLTFDEFAAAMREPGLSTEVTRSPEGGAATMTLHRRGGASCPSPYGAISRMPAFDLVDLAGKRVSSASLQGRPTLMNFYFSACVPCIREIGPLNEFAAARKDLNYLAVTFDERAEARRFAQRHGFRWRVVPDAREFIDRMAVKRYPMMALFDAQGRLLGMRAGGAKDELEAAAVGPALKRWVDGLLRSPPAAP